MIEQKTEHETITLTVSIPVETLERLVGIARLTDQNVADVIEMMTDFYGREYVNFTWEVDHGRV